MKEGRSKGVFALFPKRKIGNNGTIAEKANEKELAKGIPKKEPLDEFKEQVENARQEVLKHLSARDIQQNCIMVLSVAKNELRSKPGSKVSIIYKGYGRYVVGYRKEIAINTRIDMPELLDVIDMIPAFTRSEPSGAIEPSVELWLSKTTE